ncbi:MAG: hypothetical protein ACR2PL_00520 [Dehalococcoidia bacterium]
MSDQRKRVLGAIGVFLVLLGIYLFTDPGRIDIVDGYWRYEVAKNWLDVGEPIVTNRNLFVTPGRMLNPVTGKSYSIYNAAPSITPMPLMLLARLLPGRSPERDCFAFSLVGPLFGALLGALLVLGYGLLGIGLRESLLYTALFCLATLWWPASVTVFDQNQHAALLFSAVLLAWLAGRRESIRLAALAGLLGGLLINYQEMYALLLPAVGLAVFASPEEGSPADQAALQQSPGRAALLRYSTFGLCCCAGLALLLAYNELRFGTPLMLARYAAQQKHQPPTWGNPVTGFLGLTISPGKGIVWFSPPLILALLGARRLWARAPALALTAAGVSGIYLLVIIHLAFFGGDWCWGPRYVIPVMPLWALAFPFATARLRQPLRVVAPLVAAGLLVQVAGVSIDSHRFFYEMKLPPFRWETDQWFYFKHSQLAARPAEILASFRSGSPGEPDRFDASPTGHLISRLYGIHNPALSRVWLGDNYQLYYLPRPWWGWIGWTPPRDRPCDPAWLMAWCTAFLALGSALAARSLCASDRKSAVKGSRSDNVEPEPVSAPGAERGEMDLAVASPAFSGRDTK